MNDISRRDGESKLAHHKRLVYGKLVDKTLDDIDYTELAEETYGQPYSSDVARRMFYGSRKTLDLINEETALNTKDTDALEDIDSKIMELKKARQRFFDQRTELNKIIRERSRQEELNDIIVRTIKEGALPELECIPREPAGGVKPHGNDLLVSLNDLHYGATHSNYWGKYNSSICKEMMERYLARVIEIAETHGSENCIIWENGDVISGNIHKTIQVSNKENVVEQIIGASELIANFIAALSPHFKTVAFTSVSGNHGRLDTYKDSLLDERLDDLVEWYLKARLQNFDNVYIGVGDRIDPTVYILDIRGQNYLGVHGDFDGTDSKLQSLQMMAGKKFYAILSGHLHHNCVDEVQGVKTVMAGSFLGVDDFCVAKRIYGRPQQLVCVCDESGIVCHYDIPLARQ